MLRYWLDLELDLVIPVVLDLSLRCISVQRTAKSSMRPCECVSAVRPLLEKPRSRCFIWGCAALQNLHTELWACATLVIKLQ